MTAHSTPGAAPRSWPLICALGIGQIVSWGSMYYAFSLLLGPIERELGWGRASVVGAFSVSLLTAGAAALPAGMLLDRFGGRALMSWGSLAAAALLALLGRVESLALFYAIWVGLGVCMAATFYEPAFAVIYRSFGDSARKWVTALTLIAGFSSTVFWPLVEWLVARLGWRDALSVLAALNLLVCWPLHRLVVPPVGAGRTHAQKRSDSARSAVIPWRAARFWLLAFVFAANSLVFATLAVHLIPLLVERGLTSAHAAWVVALIGPTQVAGRLLEYTLGKRIDASSAGLIALLVLCAGLLLIVIGRDSVLMLAAGLALYGAGNGVMTIVRAVVPAEIFGRERYGTLNGALSVPVILTRAGGPVAASLAWSAGGGYAGLLWTLLLVSSAAAGAFVLATRRANPE